MIPSASFPRALGLKPKLEYSGGNKGWVGDNPFIFLDTKKIRATGWKTTLLTLSKEHLCRTLEMAPAKPVGAAQSRRLTMNIAVLGPLASRLRHRRVLRETFPGRRPGF